MSKISVCRRLFVLAVSAVLLSAAIPASAQSAGNGTINGTVTDTTGALVPNTEVVIKDTDTGALRTLITNADGYYTAPAMQSGHYEIVFGGGAFAKVDRKNLVLTVGQILTVDASLPAGSASTEITVTDVAPVLDSNKVEVSQTLSQEHRQQPPRQRPPLRQLRPPHPQRRPRRLQRPHLLPRHLRLYNSNLVDGTSNQQAFFSEARGRSIEHPLRLLAGLDQGVQASASGYSAEFGQAAGGQINAITKSGPTTSTAISSTTFAIPP